MLLSQWFPVEVREMVAVTGMWTGQKVAVRGAGRETAGHERVEPARPLLARARAACRVVGSYPTKGT
jgi:hypothetical protein